MEGQILEGPIVVLYCGRTCQLLLRQEGVFITANTSAESRLDCCGLLEGRVNIALSREEVIGAQMRSYSAFCIHYAVIPQNKRSTEQTECLLKKTKDIDCAQGGVADTFVSRIRRWALNDVQNEMERRILFLINPKAGKGIAPKIFENKIAPMIRRVFGWRFEVHLTQHKGHATELIIQADLRAYSMICIAGGDGTNHEAIQGLLQRPDRERSVNIPLVPIPLGSGNALAASLGLNRLDTVLYAVSKGSIQTLDILSIDQNTKRFYSLLGVMYGALSSLDIESEKLRWMGDVRFTIGAIRELVRMQSFKIKFAYLPFEETHPVASIDGPDGSGNKTKDPSSSNDPRSSRNCHGDVQENRDAPSLKSGMIDSKIKEWFSKCEEDGIASNGWTMCRNFDTRLMALLNLPYITKNIRFMPEANIDDGAMHLLVVPTDASSRWQMYNFLTKSESGQHISLDCVRTMKIRAFVFTPEQTCPMTIDGELVSPEPIFVEVLPGLLKTMTVPRIHRYRQN